MRPIQRLKHHAEKIWSKFIRISIKIRLKLFPNSGEIRTRIIPYSEINGSAKIVVNKLFEKAFNNDLEKHEKHWARPTHAVLGYLNKKIVVFYFIFARDCLFDDKSLSIGGFGGLTCNPVYRRLGFTRQLINKTWERVMKDFAFDYGLLVCDKKLMPFYEKFGWYGSDKSEMKLIENTVTRKGILKLMLYSPSNTQYIPKTIDINGKIW